MTGKSRHKYPFQVPAEKDRGLQIPPNEVPDYFDYREKPDDEVSGESNKDDVKVSGIEDNAAVNDGNSQVNPAKDIHSSVPGNMTAMFTTANQPWKKEF